MTSSATAARDLDTTRGQQGESQTTAVPGLPWIVAGRELVTDVTSSVLSKLGKLFGNQPVKLFGVSHPLDTNQFEGFETVIPNGDVSAFLTPRIARFQVSGIEAYGRILRLDTAIVSIAEQLTKNAPLSTSELNPRQLTRIAFEYVIQACCISVASVKPFAAYLTQALEFRQAVKALNKAAVTSQPEAFERRGVNIEQILQDARRAWATVTQMLLESSHLAALRTQFDVAPLFIDMEAWGAVKALNPEMRGSVLYELQRILSRKGHPFVDAQTIAYAHARVLGRTQLLTNGNVHGLAVVAALAAVGTSRLPGVRTNGGPEVHFDDSPASHVGVMLSGMQAGFTGSLAREDDRTILVKGKITEGARSWTMPMPIGAPWGNQTSPQRYASA